MIPADLVALARSLTGPFAFCGIAVQRGGTAPIHAVSTIGGLRADETTFFRAASLSKIVTAQTLRAVLAEAGLPGPHAAIAVEDLLGRPFRHPRAPGRPITLGQVASHSAGLSDAGGYAVPPGKALIDFIARTPGAFAAHPPGATFEYCNLGYLVLAACAEAVAGARFDLLARRHVLKPRGIAGGFNWSGVPLSQRANRLPTYRRTEHALVAQIDAIVGTGAVSVTDGSDPIPQAYRPGVDVTQLSPQGGLRLSLAGALTLARSLADTPADLLWTPDQGPTPPAFHSYGWGLHVDPAPAFYPRPLVGHFGNAYGFLGGAWYDKAADTAFAYGLNGLAFGDEAEDLHPEEARIFAAIAALIDHDPNPT